MVSLEGRVVIVTGAGRGIGREHARLLAAHGARLVVNDIGGSTTGEGQDQMVAEEVVEEIRSAGGEAVANTDRVETWSGAQKLVRTALDTYGGLDVVVNNAGIIRDRMIVNMSEEEFDAVVSVHLKGTFCVTRHAAAYWRKAAQSGDLADRSVVNTSSGSGLFNNIGQANYGAAKAAIATFSQIAAKELCRYRVRVNSIAPIARTRMTLQTPGLGETMSASETGFDRWAAGNISPLVAYLAADGCPFTGSVFHVAGGRIDLVKGWSFAEHVSREERWRIEEIDGAIRGWTKSTDEPALLSESVDMATWSSGAFPNET